MYYVTNLKTLKIEGMFEDKTEARYRRNLTDISEGTFYREVIELTLPDNTNLNEPQNFEDLILNAVRNNNHLKRRYLSIHNIDKAEEI